MKKLLSLILAIMILTISIPCAFASENVGVWAYVPEGVSLIDGLNPILGDSQSTRENYIIDNTDIAPWCVEFMDVDPDALSEELSVDVSSIGKYNSLTRQFVFNNALAEIDSTVEKWGLEDKALIVSEIGWTYEDSTEKNEQMQANRTVKFAAMTYEKVEYID
jgi:hypothetical protein